MSVIATKIVGPTDGEAGFLGSIGVRFMIDGSEAQERFALVEHLMSARALAAPLHRHTREDEYSFILEGRMGALLGDDVVEAGPGDLVHKPRDQWHTFWNAGDEPCRLLEIISPAGFERFFAELVAMGGVLNGDPQEIDALSERYGLEMRPETVPDLMQRFGVVLGEDLYSNTASRAADTATASRGALRSLASLVEAHAPLTRRARHFRLRRRPTCKGSPSARQLVGGGVAHAAPV